jgi:uncharacterized repeat protein (TIGR01451 family)
MFIQAKSQKRSFKLLNLAGFCLLIVALLLAGNTQSASARPNADTSVGGTISVDTHWTTAGSPYIVTSDLTINAGVTLTIDAGVVVRASGMVGISVYGTLNATGNSGAHVIFTSNAVSPAPGDWKGIYAGDGGNANLDYTEIRYGGGVFWWDGNGNHYGNLRKDATGTLTITNSLITQSAACGLRFDNSTGTHNITSTIISDNQNYGACLLGNTANSITFTSSTFTGNLPQSIVTTPHSSGFSIGTGNTLDRAIYVTGGAIDVNSTWSPQTYLLDDVSVNPATTLILPDGIIVKFNGMTGLVVSGTLNTTGTNGSHVIFTSNAVSPAPGDWKGIYVADGGTANLDYTEIHYGGGIFWWDGNGNHYGNLRKDATGTLTITNSLITQSAACGLRFDNSTGTHTITNTIISDNQNYGACLNVNTTNTITFASTTFSGNLPQSIVTTPHSSGFSIVAGNILDRAIYVTGGAVDVNSTWSPQTYLLDDVSVNPATTLILPAGIIVKFNGMTGLAVSGTLNATGTSGAHVIFTSNAISPAAGDWKGIYIPDGGTANLDYTEIRYGGGIFWWDGNGNHYGNLRKDATGTLTVNHSLITQSASCGLRFDNSSGTHNISNSVISDNQNYGACLNGTTSNTITFMSTAFTGNQPQSILTTPHSSGFSIGVSNTLDKAIYVTAGDIDVDSIWHPQLYLLDDVSVHAGNTLSLPAGVIVKFNGMKGLVINGTLNTSGSAISSVIFTSNAVSPAPGDWKGIYVGDGGSASLDYTEIHYGGGILWWDGNGNHYGNLRKDATGTLTITNSLITQSAGCGLRFDNSTGTHTITSTIISDNLAYGACLNGTTANAITFASTTFSGNLPQSVITTPHSSGFSIGSGNTLDRAIYVTGGAIDVNSTWSPQVYLVDDLSVNAGNTLALPAGVVVKFNGMTGLVVSGTLNSNGVDGSKVVFTSLKDDTRGDTNGDSNATTPAAGDWKGIYVPDGGNANLGYTEIRYGGGILWWDGNGNHYGNLRKDATGTLTITNSLITQSAGCGLRFDNSTGTHTIANTIISGNQNYGTCLYGNTSNTITFTNSTFSGNLPQSVITTPHSSGFSIGSSNTLDKSIYVIGGAIDVNSTWSPQIYLLDDVSVNAGNTLALPAGAVVKFNGMTGLVVSGTLNTTGTSGSPVVFTSNAVSPAAGDWKGIYVSDGGSASLDYTEIRYGGGNFWWDGGGNHWGNLRKDATGTLTLTNSLITQSAGNGLRIVNSSSTAQISNLHIFDNAGWGLSVESSSSNLMLASSLIDHNGVGGISLSNPGATVHVYSSTIVANTGVGIWLGNETPAVIGGTDENGNNLYGNTTLQLQNASTISNDASNNWWGINPPDYSGIAGNVDTSSPLSGQAANAPAYLADIAITSTGLPGTGLIGEAIIYPLQIDNNGPHEAYYVKVSATLPVGVTLTGFNGTDWTCNQVDQQLICVQAYLASGAESALELTLVSPRTVHMIFDFTVSQANNDVVPANNVLSIDTQVNTRIFLPLIQR